MTENKSKHGSSGPLKLVELNNNNNQNFDDAVIKIKARTKTCIEYYILVKDETGVMREERGSQYARLSPPTLCKMQAKINENLKEMWEK